MGIPTSKQEGVLSSFKLYIFLALIAALFWVGIYWLYSFVLSRGKAIFATLFTFFISLTVYPFFLVSKQTIPKDFYTNFIDSLIYHVILSPIVAYKTFKYISIEIINNIENIFTSTYVLDCMFSYFNQYMYVLHRILN